LPDMGPGVFVGEHIFAITLPFNRGFIVRHGTCFLK
jgi:hypothetical protein